MLNRLKPSKNSKLLEGFVKITEEVSLIKLHPYFITI
jgi:hypothetical protein